MEKFTKKGLNELKKEKEFNTKVERRIINDIINTGLTTSELKNYIKTILKYDEIYRLIDNEDMVRFFDTYRTEILTMLGNSDKIVHYFDSTFWLDRKRYTDAEKNSLVWFIYQNIIYRIANYFSLIYHKTSLYLLY